MSFMGSWKLIESTNFDDVMKALGINAITRAASNSAKPVVTISPFGTDGVTVQTKSTLKKMEVSAKYGEEVKEKTSDGREVMSTFTKNSESQLTQTQKHSKADTLIVRTVEGNKLTAKVSVGDLVSTRIYEKV